MEGYHYHVVCKKVFIDAKKKYKRLVFTWAHKHWTVEDWRRVIWTNECYIYLGGARRTIYVTSPTQEEYKEECIVPKFKKRDSVMVWGGFVGGKKAPLVLWEKDDWGTITSDSYVEHILHPVLWPFWYWESQAQGERGPLWVMEDGASAHRARYNQAHCDYYQMPLLVWPPSSPDLNPIENIWFLLKNRIEK